MQSSMSEKKAEVISMPASPSSVSSNASTTTDVSTGSTDSLLTDKPKDLIKLSKSLSKKRRYLTEKVRECRDNTMECTVCKTINKYLKILLSDENCRRITAVAILLFAIIGFYHVLKSIIL